MRYLRMEKINKKTMMMISPAVTVNAFVAAILVVPVRARDRLIRASVPDALPGHRRQNLKFGLAVEARRERVTISIEIT